MSNSTVNIITNPENTLAFDSTGKAVLNGIPEYQNFVPYVELYAIRYNEVQAIMTNKGSILRTSGSDDSELVSFMGYKASKDNKNNQYTAGYTDYIGSLDESNLYEGFGITDIDVDMKSKLVPQVTIKFVDVKGVSFFDTSKDNKNSYRVLFDFEPPIFVLLLKGVFGETTRYELHLLSTNTKFDSSTGNFIVTAKFVGKTFAPLSDIRLGWLKTASFLDKPQTLLSLDNTGPVDNYFELITRGKNYYNDIKVLVQDKEEKTKKDNENTKLSNLNSLEDYFFKANLYINRPKEPINYINTSIFQKNGTISNQSNTEPLNNQIFYSFLVDDSDLESINNANVLDIFYKSLIEKKLIQYNDLDITYDAGDVYIIKTIEDRFIKYHLVLTKFYEKIFNKRKTVKKTIDESNKKIKDKLDKSIRKNLGFDPTIGNIFDIILNDATIFMNALKNAGSTKHSKVDGNVLDNAAFPRVIKLDNINGVTTQVNDYPGNYPEYKNWGEVKFVENFINTYIAVKKYENVLETTQANDAQGISKMIPCGVFDIENKDLNYFNNNTNIDDIFTTLFKRYTLATQYSYKGKIADITKHGKGFVSKNVKGDDIFLVNDIDSPNVIEYIANLESENIIASLYDVKLLKLIKNYINNVSDDTFIKSFNKLEGTKYVLNNGMKNLSVNNRTLYSNNTTNYQGLRILSDVDKPIIITIDDKELENEKPLKSYGKIFEPKLFKWFFNNKKVNRTNTNLLLLSDTLNNNKITESVFYNTDFIETIAKLYNERINISYNYDDFNFFLSLGISNEIKFDDVYDYFLSPSIIEMPKFIIVYIGEVIANINNNLNNSFVGDSSKLENLSDADKKIFTNFYETYKIKLSDFRKELDDCFVKSGGLLDKNNPRGTNVNLPKFIEEIKKTKTFYPYFFGDDKVQYITNDSSFTFLNAKDYNPNFEVLVNQDNTFNDKWILEFWNKFKSNIIPLLDEKIKVNEEQNKEIESNVKDSDLKTELYYSFKTFYDRWLKNDYFNGDTFFKDKFSYVDRAFNPIGDKAYIDFSPLLDYDDTPKTELYGALSTMLSHNNFEFFPLPNFINYKEDANGVVDTSIWQKIFNVNPSVNLNQKPAFICMYVGGYSSQNDENDYVKFNDPAQSATDFGDSAFSFNINFGIQNQTIFNNIDIDTSEIKETGESLQLIDEIFKKKDSATPILKKQNLFNVYEQRAYSCTVTIPFGNTCIQPTTYFELKNVPMFNGVYIILEVSHKINSNNNKLETTFKGTRIRRYIVPYITDPIMTVFGTSAELNEQQNDTPMNTSAIDTYDENKFWIRKDSSQTKNIIRYTNGKYVKI